MKKKKTKRKHPLEAELIRTVERLESNIEHVQRKNRFLENSLFLKTADFRDEHKEVMNLRERNEFLRMRLDVLANGKVELAFQILKELKKI